MLIPIDYNFNSGNQDLINRMTKLEESIPDQEHSNFFTSEAKYNSVWGATPFSSKSSLVDNFMKYPISDVLKEYHELSKTNTDDANTYLESKIDPNIVATDSVEDPYHVSMVTSIQKKAKDEYGITLTNAEVKSSLLRHYVTDTIEHSKHMIQNTLGSILVSPVMLAEDAVGSVIGGDIIGSGINAALFVASFSAAGKAATLAKSGILSAAEVFGVDVAGVLSGTATQGLGSAAGSTVGKMFSNQTLQSIGRRIIADVGEAGALYEYSKFEKRYGINPIRRDLGLPEEEEMSFKDTLIGISLYKSMYKLIRNPIKSVYGAVHAGADIFDTGYIAGKKIKSGVSSVGAMFGKFKSNVGEQSEDHVFNHDVNFVNKFYESSPTTLESVRALNNAVEEFKKDKNSVSLKRSADIFYYENIDVIRDTESRISPYIKSLYMYADNLQKPTEEKIKPSSKPYSDKDYNSDIKELKKGDAEYKKSVEELDNVIKNNPDRLDNALNKFNTSSNAYMETKSGRDKAHIINRVQKHASQIKLNESIFVDEEPQKTGRINNIKNNLSKVRNFIDFQNNSVKIAKYSFKTLVGIKRYIGSLFEKIGL